MVSIRHGFTRIQRYASKLCVIKFQRISGLLDLPVADPRMSCGFRQEGLDLGSAQIASRTVWKKRKESPHPADAVRDVNFLGTCLSQYRNVALWPLGIGVVWCSHLKRRLIHSIDPYCTCYGSKHHYKSLNVNSRIDLKQQKYYYLRCYF